MKFIDLHTHSILTDGSYTPKELVRLAKAVGLSAIAITDHDNLQAYHEAKDEAKTVGIKLMTGIELSVAFKGGRIHLLGLGFDIDDPAFLQAYASFRQPKEACVAPVLENLRKQGLKIDETVIAPYKIGETVDRYTLFRYFVAHQEKEDVQYIWDTYLNPALKGTNLNLNIEAKAAIDLIKCAGGITSLAHFHKNIGLKRFSPVEKEACIKELRDMGLDALEVRYPDYTKEDQHFMERMAAKYDLLETGGTDFHGANRPMVELGAGISGNVAVPYDCYEKILTRCRKTT